MKKHSTMVLFATLTLVAAGAAAQSTDPAEPRTDNTPTSNGAQPSNDTSTAAPGAERPSTISTDPQQEALATGLSEADRAVAEQLRDLAAKLGSSIAHTLRVYASEMREKRRMRAEEKAHRLPVLISIPLVACMLPVMIGVLLLPAVIRVMRSVLPAMQGGAVG